MNPIGSVPGPAIPDEQLVDCKVCDGGGVIPEAHEDGAHPVPCLCTYRRPCDLLCRCSGGPL